MDTVREGANKQRASTSSERSTSGTRGPSNVRHTDLLRLQRQVGNRATTALLARELATPSLDGIIQRQSLSQSGLPQGVAESHETMKLVGNDSRAVRVYTMIHIDPQTQMNESSPGMSFR